MSRCADRPATPRRCPRTSSFEDRLRSVRRGTSSPRPCPSPIVGDALDEPDETFLLELTGATGATIDDGQGLGTIPGRRSASRRAGGTDFALRPRRLRTGDATIATIDVYACRRRAVRKSRSTGRTADGTGTEADSDYAGGSGTLHFAPGETDKAVLITVIGDMANETDETFTVMISSPAERET